MRYEYLFRQRSNGYGDQYDTYQPFFSSRKITQEMADEIMRKASKGADRIGSSISDLIMPLEDAGVEIKKYKSVYRLPRNNESDLDPLPECMKEFTVIESIMGNY